MPDIAAFVVAERRRGCVCPLGVAPAGDVVVPIPVDPACPHHGRPTNPATAGTPVVDLGATVQNLRDQAADIRAAARAARSTAARCDAAAAMFTDLADTFSGRR